MRQLYNKETAFHYYEAVEILRNQRDFNINRLLDFYVLLFDNFMLIFCFVCKYRKEKK